MYMVTRDGYQWFLGLPVIFIHHVYQWLSVVNYMVISGYQWLLVVNFMVISCYRWLSVVMDTSLSSVFHFVSLNMCSGHVLFVFSQNPLQCNCGIHNLDFLSA